MRVSPSAPLSFHTLGGRLACEIVAIVHGGGCQVLRARLLLPAFVPEPLPVVLASFDQAGSERLCSSQATFAQRLDPMPSPTLCAIAMFATRRHISRT